MADDGCGAGKTLYSPRDTEDEPEMRREKKPRLDLALEAMKHTDMKLRELIVQHQIEKNEFRLKAIDSLNRLELYHERQRLAAETQRLATYLKSGQPPPPE